MGSSPGSTTILHISDLHFGPYFNSNAAAALLKFAHTVPADALIVSGDFTQRAKREQYEAARSFLKELPQWPSLYVPGNHDIPLYRVFERLFTPYDLYREHITDELEPVLKLPGAVIVGLNTTRPYQTIKNGVIDASQLARLKREFSDLPPEVARLVTVHHHFLANPDPKETRPMRGAIEALKQLESLRVELVMSGHLHCSFIGNSRDVIPSNPDGHGVTVVQCGSTTSHRGRGRERKKNSCNVIVIDPAVIRVVHYLNVPISGGFVPMSEHVYPRYAYPHLGQ